MIKNNFLKNKKFVISICLLLAMGIFIYGRQLEKPLVLQEMTWGDVDEYLKTCDMAIIPLGSTEQHGPHLPLGTDFFEADEIAKSISARTGVITAPVLLAGYSTYHSGFPGTLSLKPETMEQVLFETVEMLIKYGFRRFMFFNYHGGNSIITRKVIHKINHNTAAIAINIGIDASFQDFGEEVAPFDHHAGVGETSIMLYLRPELVKMERAKKPNITLSAKVKELQELSKMNPGFDDVAGALLGVPVETKKGGASHEISDNGIWTSGDPKTATKERGEQIVERMVNAAVKFILAWKEAKN